MHEHRVLAIFDEIHHAADRRAWGDALEAAFGDAVIRLELSGTPFREDEARIPFVTYGEDGVCRADYPYSYARALADHVCRPVSFRPVRQLITFRGPTSDDEQSRALAQSIDPDKGIVKDLVVAADAELTRKRERWPDAGALLLARDQDDARGCASIVESVCGEKPAVVISDNVSAESDLRKFQQGTGRWLIAVRMVSEGVDIPRLMVGAFATNITASLFFRQFVGRVIRVRDPSAQETAAVFIPNDGRLIAEAGEIEDDVQNHAVAAGLDIKPARPRSQPSIPSPYQINVSYRAPLRMR
jgi:superfamily II DNA or RNA helicase